MSVLSTFSDPTALTGKTISLAANTVTGTTAEFNTALSDGSFATLAGAETLTGKTYDDAVFTGEITEQVYTLTGTTPALDPANGTIQVWTLTANSTPTDSLATGQSMLLLVDDGTAYSITWPTMTWKTGGGTAPALQASGYTPILLMKVASTLYGFRAGDA